MVTNAPEAPGTKQGNTVPSSATIASDRVIKRRLLLRKVLIFSAATASLSVLGIGTYYLVKRHRTKIKLVSSILAAAKLDQLVVKTPEFLKVPDFLGLRITEGQNVGQAITEMLDFVKVVQYDPSFKHRGNIVKSENLLNLIYDRMENLISLQSSADFNPRSMRSIERCIYVLCKKSLTHQQICKKIETRQLIQGLAFLLDKTKPKT